MNRTWRALCVTVTGLLLLAGCTRPNALRVARGPGPIQPHLAALAKADPARPVSVIVQTDGNTQALIRSVAALGGKVTSTWRIIPGFAAELPAGAVQSLAAAEGVRWVSLDSPLASAAAPMRLPAATELASAYQEAVRADKVWPAGLTGAGIGVAVIDTGIADATHRDLTGRVAARATFHADATDAADWFGHGTHVAGILAGSGAASGGRYVGIAPGAQLINLKVSDDQGNATERGLLDALDWVSENRTTDNIRVVNISSTTAVAQSCATSPLCAAVEALWWDGVAVVVAAGNLGDGRDAVHYPPANNPFVITVGAIADQGTKRLQDDIMPQWSSRGLTQEGYRKPDILAPGSRIVSVAAPGSILLADHPQNQVEGDYLMLGGTSMAAPVISGIVALMLEEDPDLTPDQVKWILMDTGRRWGGQDRTDPAIVQADRAVWYSFSRTPGRANSGISRSSANPAGDADIRFHMLFWTVSPDL